MNQKLKQKKQNAVAFYKMSYEGTTQKAVDLYVGAEWDLVALHTHQIWPDNIEYVTMY